MRAFLIVYSTKDATDFHYHGGQAPVSKYPAAKLSDSVGA
jgi:hypothetical protein